MDLETVLYILLALLVLVLLIWAVRRAKRTEDPFVDQQTAAALDKLMDTPLRPEDVPRAVARRLGPLPPASQPRQTVAPQPDDSGGDTLTSGLVGYHTNSTLLGVLVGGSIVGAAVGDALKPDAPSCNQTANADPESADTDTADTGSDSCSNE